MLEIQDLFQNKIPAQDVMKTKTEVNTAVYYHLEYTFKVKVLKTAKCSKCDREHDFDVILKQVVTDRTAEVDMSQAFKYC